MFSSLSYYTPSGIVRSVPHTTENAEKYNKAIKKHQDLMANNRCKRYKPLDNNDFAMRLRTQKLPISVNVALIEEGETTVKTTELDVESDMSPNNYTQFYKPKTMSIKENHAQSTNLLSPN